MKDHFIFLAGDWVGAGRVTFSTSPDVLTFRTKWSIAPQDDGSIRCVQSVELIGGDRLTNIFEVVPKNGTSFDISLENELLGTSSGVGICDEKQVAWELRGTEIFEGYEIYTRIQPFEYSMHAEYISSDQSRTIIRGKIWKRYEEPPENMDIL